MLSGLEMAGLLLATLPIFQVATTPDAQTAHIEHLRTTVSSRRETQKLSEFLKDLHFEASILQLTLDRLIDQLVTLSDFERRSLKLGDDTIWEEPRVERALKKHLSVCYDSFCIHVTGLLEVLESLVEDTTSDLPSDQAEVVRQNSLLDSMDLIVLM